MVLVLINLLTTLLNRVVQVRKAAEACESWQDDECVKSWIRQQERVKEAIAAAKRQSTELAASQRVERWEQPRAPESVKQGNPADIDDTGDEWVDGWVRQQRRVAEALAAAKQSAPRSDDARPR